jgi:Predicted Fe-S protein
MGMSNDPRFPLLVPLTPCIGVCRLDARGYCVGCQRSGEEIARWRGMDDAERLHYMDEILPARESS